jgi:hypothetical protein
MEIESDVEIENGRGSIGDAIICLKNGFRVYRKGWNGKGVWLGVWGFEPRDGNEVSPCITMKTALDTYQPGWLASQADLLAEDWCVLEEDLAAFRQVLEDEKAKEEV